MKKLTLIFALTFSVMFSSSSYAGWTKVSESTSGTVFYVDFERIRKHGGHVYFWDLSDYEKPLSGGFLSDKSYNQGDCALFRYKPLRLTFHEEPMGGGAGIQYPSDKDWTYPAPNSVNEEILQSVCNR